MERFLKLFEDLRKSFLGLPSNRRWGLLAVTTGTIAVVMLVWGMLFRDPMVPLFDSPIDEETAQEVLDILNKRGVQYSVDRVTAAILVPASEKQQLRIDTMAETGLGSQGVGLELFDEVGFGSTQFVEHIRYIRALQGEIERQINGFQKVRGSKVLLSIPEESLFVEDREDPSASVYLELATGASLGNEEGDRMASMVANAVPRLRADRVEILDSNMRVIHAAQTGDGDVTASDRIAELRRQYERYYQRKVESLLERVVGAGKVVARVSVELDSSARHSVERRLDPDRAVAVSQRSRETLSVGQSMNPQGVPGTTANLPELANQVAPGVGGNGAAATTRQTETDEIGNFDVPETRLTSTTEPGSITSVTAAVFVDGQWVDASGNAATLTTPADQRTYKARTDDELTAYAAMVAKALGTDVENVTVQSQRFAEVEVAQASTGANLFQQGAQSEWIRSAMGALALVAIFLVVVRPFVKQLSGGGAAGAALLGGPEGGGEGAEGGVGEKRDLHAWLAQVSAGRTQVTRDDVNRLVTTDINHSVAVLQSWIGRD